MQILILVCKHNIYLAKTAGVVVGGLGRQKMEVSSYAHMLICALKFLCEHFFTCQFCALMPKISKENFAGEGNKEWGLTFEYSPQ